MNYIKTYEQLKDYYDNKVHGIDNNYFFVVTNDEKFILSSSWNRVLNKTRTFPLSKVENLPAYTNDSYNFKSEGEAQKFIDMINSGPNGYKGIDINGDVPVNLKVRKVDWDENILPYKGYLTFSLEGGLDNNIRKEYPELSIERNTKYHIGSLIFQDDGYHRYEPYQHYQGSKRLYTDLKNNIKMVSYTNALIRTDNNENILGFGV